MSPRLRLSRAPEGPWQQPKRLGRLASRPWRRNCEAANVDLWAAWEKADQCPSPDVEEDLSMLRFPRVLPLLLFALLGCTRSFPVYDVRSLTPKAGAAALQKDYLFYALPRTVVAVDVPITKTVEDPVGPCTTETALRQKLLLDAPPVTKKTTYAAAKPMITTRAEPDPAAVYAVDLRFRPFALTSGTFELTDNGVLTTASVSQEDQSLDAVLSAAKLALTVSGATPLAASVGGTTIASQPAVSVCEDTYRAIRDIRARRLQLISESVRQESPTEAYLNVVLGKLEESEQALTSAFTGTVQKTVATINCAWRPSAFDTGAAGRDLFYFSKEGGPFTTAGSTCIIPGSVRGGPHATQQLVSAHIVRDDDGQQFADTVRGVQRPASSTARGFYYRIPASAIVSVEFGAEPRAREIKSFAQFGTTTTLPTLGGAFVRKAAMAPTLNAAGGLQKLVLNGEPGGNAALTGASDLVTSVVKAEADEEKEKVAARAAANDELSQLERQRKILEEKQKIAEAQKKLAELAEEQP
jgi:hypothetical protein